MDRKTLKIPFTKDRTPDWICPSCGKGLLRINQDSFSSEELACSRDHSHDAWEPEWMKYVYSCLLFCTNDKCKEVVSSVGVGSVDWSIQESFGPDGEPEEVYEDFFRPKYFEPPLKIVEIPPKCPDTVADPIEESFRLVFSSPSSSANSIRIAVEQLLTEIDIKRFRRVNGKRRLISLHQRISLLPSKYAEIKDLILAIKWLGNAGSHSKNEITFDDVMDAYEFLEHILQEIFTQKTKKLKERAKKVNKKKGPANSA